MESEKRTPRSYKMQDTTYLDAMGEAIIDGMKLANIVELFVSKYANGDAETKRYVQKLIKQAFKNK